MYTLNELQQIINNKINSLNIGGEPRGLFEPIEYVLSIGGKRIRPALCLLGYQLFSSEKLSDEIIHPAIGLEIFHNFTLLHDDVMDKADMRRNMPTVHKKWDENTAILSGDAMMIKAYQFITKCPAPVLGEVMDTFNELALGVCEGQQYDMDFENRNDVSVDEYIEMIRLKTSVLIAGSLKIGAIIGGASPKDKELLYDFGEKIGIAFQLQDDFLDVYGDSEAFGKKIGGDIVNNKKTFLLLTALRKAEGRQKDNLYNWLSVTGNDEEKIKAIRKIYNELNIPQDSETLMNNYFNSALKALDQISGDDSVKNDLKHFAINLIKRAR
ncbi:MAG: polyprenyl synthetase family protein [Chlorobi bacterium]|nr:polyprenyl synthetase family protein [Chlorobiota bacterium]